MLAPGPECDSRRSSSLYSFRADIGLRCDDAVLVRRAALVDLVPYRSRPRAHGLLIKLATSSAVLRARSTWFRGRLGDLGLSIPGAASMPSASTSGENEVNNFDLIIVRKQSMSLRCEVGAITGVLGSVARYFYHSGVAMYLRLK